MSQRNANQWRRVRRLFSQCAECATEEEAHRVLAAEPDAAVRREVAGLLSLRREPGLAVDRRLANIFQNAEGVTAGATLRGRYRLERFVAAGGVGEVFEAVDGLNGARVAVKLVRVFAVGEAERARSRVAFEREARVAGLIDHPNVCRIWAVDLEHEPPFCVMDFLDGRTLAEHLAAAGPFPPTRALSVARDICAGLAAAHAHGIVHRDLKPGNVMITEEGRAVIIDFGLAMAAGREAAEAEGLVGTPAYLAPEVLAGGPATVAADLYSLGVLLFELLSGKKPGGTLNAPPAWRDVIEACLAVEPSRRPASAAEVEWRLTGGGAGEVAPPPLA